MATRPAAARFLLRLPAGLHERLQAEAHVAGLSLNEYCVRRLGAPGAAIGLDEGAGAVVGRAAALLGPHLVAVVAHGSWTRGQATTASDIDVLAVVDAACPVTRRLYARWDEHPVRWHGRQVDVHFVQSPDRSRAPSALWCEAAIDGVVLFERDPSTSVWLAQVRGLVAAGHLVRKTVHGQPYWTEVA